MKQNNISAISLLQHFVNNVLRGNLLAVRLPPVVRVNFLPDNQIPHILRQRQFLYFFRKFRLVIDSIRRPEQNRFHSQRAFNQPLRNI